MVCILVEMYTGELFFEPREDIEHLAMAEKQSGPIPEWMCRQAKNKEVSDIYYQNYKIGFTDNYEMRIEWPSVAKKASQY